MRIGEQRHRDRIEALVDDAEEAEARMRKRRLLGMVAAVRKGWESYLEDPSRTNQRMQALNKAMSAQTFADSAAAQYGRGMVTDVNRVLVDDFVDNMKATLEGEAPAAGARSAGGFMIGLRAMWMALKRVAARFFLPYDPARV